MVVVVMMAPLDRVASARCSVRALGRGLYGGCRLCGGGGIRALQRLQEQIQALERLRLRLACSARSLGARRRGGTAEQGAEHLGQGACLLTCPASPEFCVLSIA